MKVNRERWHLFVKPEDDANRQIVNGFVESLDIAAQAKIQVDRPAGGYMKALEFIADAQLERFPQRRLLVVIDFDNAAEFRRKLAERYASVCERVFVVGAKPEAEDLRRELDRSLERCGEKIAEDCVAGHCAVWSISSLDHNREALAKLCPEIYRELIPHLSDDYGRGGEGGCHGGK